MSSLPSSYVFNVDYQDLDQVIKLAIALGPGMLVIKYSDRFNYNITHADRENSVVSRGAEVVFRS